MVEPLVSIIIPCFNAEQWIAEAIQSALDQTYRNIEVIVIDDGSTDNSADVIRSFGSLVRWEGGPNRGGNHARNRGFALSRGEFVQFLDADDVLLADKLTQQVAVLVAQDYDVVYSDWRHQYHESSGGVTMGPVEISGPKEDMVAALLSRWWVPSLAILWRRSFLKRVGGWDESLVAAQDCDFMISAALAGARFGYVPGCHSIYRRYGNVTVSTSNRPRWLESHARVIEKAEATLVRNDQLTAQYRTLFAMYWFSLARTYYDFSPAKFAEFLKRAKAFDANFPVEGSTLYRWTRRFFGYAGAERIAHWKRKISPVNGADS